MNHKLHEIFGLDLRTLALFRVLLGLLLLGELAARLPDARAFYTDAGVVPVAMVPNNVALSVHLLNGSLEYQYFLFAVAGVFAVLLTVGWHTRLALLVSWFLLISLQGRNVAVQHNGDVFLRNYLFFAIFLPLGAVWSVDARFRPRPAGVGPQFLNGGTIAYLLQMCFVYWFAVIWKSAPEWRTEFSAVHYALHLEPLASPVAVWLRQIPWLTYLLTISTMIIEAIGPLLLLFPFATQWCRLLAVALFIGLHASFGACLVLGNFAFVCWVGWVAFLPPLFWDLLARWTNTTARRAHAVRYAGAVPPRLQALRSLLLVEQVPLQPSGTGQSGWWVHDTTTATDLTGAAALRRLLWLSPIFWVLAWLPADLLTWLAGWIEKPAQPAPDAAAFRERALQPYRGLVLNALALFCITYIGLWNVRTVATEKMRQAFPPQISGLGFALAFSQDHGVFAPSPAKRYGWYVLAAQLADGSKIDLLTGKEPDLVTKPDNIYRLYINSRWRGMMLNFTTPLYRGLLPYYTDWQRREWNRLHPDNPLVVLELWYLPLEAQYPGGLKQHPATLLYRLTTRSIDREPKP